MAHTIRAIRQDRKESVRARRLRQLTRDIPALAQVVSADDLTPFELEWLRKTELEAEYAAIDPTLCSKWVVL